MKPVNLLPTAAVRRRTTAAPSRNMIGGIAAGAAMLVLIVGYFAMARVSSVKDEAQAANDRAAQAMTEAATIRTKVQTLGPAPVDSDHQLAQGAEEVLLAAYTERRDYVRLVRELHGIMDGTGGWYEDIKASSSSLDGDALVTITGVMPSAEILTAFNERANGTRSLDDAVTTSIKSVVMRDDKTKKPGRYWRFTMTAKLTDQVAPNADASAASAGNGDGTTVSSGGNSDLKLSLLPEPRPTTQASRSSKPAAAAAAKPSTNAFDVAADAAAGGAG